MPSLTKYAKSGDVHVAYQVIGKGSLDLVVAPGFISHLEHQQKEPTVAQAIARFSSFSRLICFDKRGTGLSDPVSSAASLEERVDDLRAVLDAAGSTKAAIFGSSEGGPMAALFAATYPERTSALILYGSFARQMWAPDYPFGISEQQYQKLLGFVDRWGDGVGLGAWAPSMAKDPVFRDWWAELQRLSASPGMIRSLFKLYPEIDIRSVLPAIRVPTLVMHRTGDRVCHVGNGRFLAENIPGSRYVELDGDDHMFYTGNSGALMDEVEEFLTGARHGAETDRALLTIMFTDIVGATQTAERIGDESWRKLLERHHATVRAQLTRFRGREVDTAGDGFFATFDGPARAVRCAQAICDAVRALGIEVRVGLHTGECETAGAKVTGVAVHIAARVAAAAAGGQVLVSSTVKDLVAGSGLTFASAGTRQLKGISDEWRLFALN